MFVTDVEHDVVSCIIYFAVGLIYFSVIVLIVY